ncbi:G2/mitotic-specific cyclin-2-like [Euphorbia lathyris]|uniref:G2/mitotic-specific cyclin-2-like n=1 Tax=Euphorbia lathyris TaxID=212925 RepID=UPI003313A40A
MENNPNIAKPPNFQEMGSRKFGQEIRNNRRALNVLNQNFMGSQAYNCVVNKRSLSESHGVCGYKPNTRKFAAQISSSHQEESKKQKASISSTNGFGDCIFIDVEDENVIDHPEPMFLEQTEEEKEEEEEEEMEEVEMEIEEAVLDIDGSDSNNSLAIVDYIEDLHVSYRKMESYGCVSPDYMTQQEDINEKMRAILIDWLIEVHDKFELMKETLFLTINLIDRFLSKQKVMRKKLQLVGLVAMLLACKYEEVSVPVVDDLILISDKAYTRKEILEMEKLMLSKLQFNMSFPTPYVFLLRFLKAAQCDNKIEMLSFFLIELSLVEYEMLRFSPSLLAASAVYTAQCAFFGFKEWSRTCELHTKYSQLQLLECSRMMVGFHQKAGTGKLTGVYRKYNSSKFGYTSSRSEAAAFLLLQNEQDDDEL